MVSRVPRSGLKRAGFVLLLLALLALPTAVLAQSYYFNLAQQAVDVYWQTDGSASIDYLFVFQNDPGGAPIEFVDVGVPNRNFSESTIQATVDDQPVGVSVGEYQGDGSGVAVVLGSQAIQPGARGAVRLWIPDVRKVVYVDDNDPNYASAVFSPTWFGSEYVSGTTDLSVTFHLPEGVQPNEPRWHSAPAGFPSEPVTGIDDQGRVTYTWRNPQAYAYEQYTFGASFPSSYIPAETIVRPAKFMGVLLEDLLPLLLCCGFGLFFVAMVYFSIRSSQKRRMQYLSPKIAIEGHGIKRGLTAVEAALLLEQPLDKILTMILFGVIKKGAATVRTQDPLELDITTPPPADLQPYEKTFLEAFGESTKAGRRKALQALMVDLVKSLGAKLKGFSRKESADYYRSIMERAWAQVEAADTPEVKSQKYEEALEWTMLDRDYEDRTKRTFSSGPVFLPGWWGRYDPVYRTSGPASTIPSSAPTGGGQSSGGGGISLPSLPGGAFAASVVQGVQNFSGGVIGSLTDFTGGVTNVTNPVPTPPPATRSGGSRGGGGGGGCACACACAGCACACAGGGR